MKSLKELQDDFQRGILAEDDAILAEINDSGKEDRKVLFGVYRYAYGSRLVEAMRKDHELLHLYLGGEMFDEMGHAYVKARPSSHPNLRWFAQGLPAFLKSAGKSEKISAEYTEMPATNIWCAHTRNPNTAMATLENATALYPKMRL